MYHLENFIISFFSFTSSCGWQLTYSYTIWYFYLCNRNFIVKTMIRFLIHIFFKVALPKNFVLKKPMIFRIFLNLLIGIISIAWIIGWINFHSTVIKVLRLVCLVLYFSLDLWALLLFTLHWRTNMEEKFSLA